MYAVDEKDEVVELAELPQSSVGAPCPLVIADEHHVVVAYYLEDRDPAWDGSTVRIVGPESSDEPVALVRFAACRAHTLGPPNDEAFAGHPLADRGLEPYGSFEIRGSSWIRMLERMNSVHPYHRPEAFSRLRHLILTFHDSTFECVCAGFSVTTTRGSILSQVPTMVSLLAGGNG